MATFSLLRIPTETRSLSGVSKWKDSRPGQIVAAAKKLAGLGPIEDPSGVGVLVEGTDLT
jgi:hypothetical protein